MLVAKLLVVVGIAQVPSGPADPAELVRQLGAARYAAREAASAALERLGRPALKALRAARDARDPEIRTRAYNLIQRIEGNLLTQPSRVRLEFDQTPLHDVMKSVSTQAGFKVALQPENVPRWRSQRVTLHQPEPLPFWKAIDRLCDAAQLQYNPSQPGFGNPREPTFTLTDGALRTVTPVSDHGPFRVSLLGLLYQSELNYAAVGGFRPPMGADRGVRPRAGAPARLHPVSNVQFLAKLLVAAEPRLSVSLNGALQVLEAVDDRGNSLIPSGALGTVPTRFPGYFGMTHGAVLPLQAPLERPATVGKTLKTLRGAIPLTVSSRRPDPLIVPLNQGTGKRFENPDVELTLHEIRTAPNTHQTLIEFSLKPNEHRASAEHDVADAWTDPLYRTDTQRLQLEILDSRDQLVPCFPSGVDSETSHVTLTVTNLAHTSALKELRYHTLTRASLNVPFEFHDIPIP
ncbi:MAG TPA: hypothetical protein VFF52_05140 [Isosphaeraceae bacterium]|nr:hypothetical protein [Isosphaeraceae bacterium]